MFKDVIFREYDIRGIVGRDFNEEFSFILGKVFGSLLREQNRHAHWVSVGRDARLSSNALATALIQGIVSTGISVYDIGLCPTPLQYFSIHHLNLDGGVMVTGSHNPPEYNGFKLSVGNHTIFGDAIRKIKQRIQERSWSENAVPGATQEYDILTAYRAFMEQRFSLLAAPRYRRLKIVVDAGNGTAGIVAPDILKSMGCDVIPLYCEPDGRFPTHHPDPTVPENIQDLIRLTKESSADIGVGYDGDGDRIGVVDPAGNIVWGDQIMIMLSREILRKRPGSVIIGDVKCSERMFDDIGKHGGIPIMWRTGHSLVKDKMRRENAVLAGEFSGHIFIGDDYFGFDDAIYTTLRIVEIIKKSGAGIQELLADIPRTVYTPEIRIEYQDDQKKDIVEKLTRLCKEYAKSGNSPIPIQRIYDIDGARVVFEKGWGLVRASNTQPVIVMRFEAEDEESLKIYRAFLEGILRSVSAQPDNKAISSGCDASL